jgi:glyoxylase-like metal-dependent hydrolase (beta-lactamase superfamily II)
MMKNQKNPFELHYKVFTVSRSGLTRDPNMPATPDDLKWVANSSTLIYGEHDAVLIDCFLTIDQSMQLIDFVNASGKNLTYIYITHPHGDHFFGLKLILEHFPGAKAITAASSAADMVAHIDPKSLDTFWRPRFPGQIVDELVAPDALKGNSFELEGHSLEIIEDGFTDTHNSTSIWVPSIKLIVAGDVVDNGIHAYLAETTSATRKEWVNALDRLAFLKPDYVVAGHKKPDEFDHPEGIEVTKQYLLDFEKLNEETTLASDFYLKMFGKYPNYANPGSLWGAVVAAKS